jgi:signal peptidase I
MKPKKLIRGQKSASSTESPLDFAASNCALLVVVFFVFGFVFENFVIPSSSMASTLLVGDHVMVDRLTLSPSAAWAPFQHYREVKRNDIVVFYKPTEEPNGEHRILVKRVIGIPGDRIHLSGGVVYLNGKAQEERHAARPPYADYDAYRDDFPAILPGDRFGATAQWSLEMLNHIQSGDLTVPAGSYFVLGDNRTKSADSRYWGFVPRRNIIGRPLFVYWSFVTPDGLLDDPSIQQQASFTLHEVLHFFDQTRWARTFHRVE